MTERKKKMQFTRRGRENIKNIGNPSQINQKKKKNPDYVTIQFCDLQEKQDVEKKNPLQEKQREYFEKQQNSYYSHRNVLL